MAKSVKLPDLKARAQRGAQILVETCAVLRSGEKALVLSNPETRDVAQYVLAECRRVTDQVRHEELEPLTMHGSSPPPHIGPAMLWADAVFCLTKMSLAHTAERRAANEHGTRYLSLPDYDLELLGGDSLMCDFRSAGKEAQRLKRVLSDARTIRVRTEAGTDLTFSAAGRTANACGGACHEPGTLGSPPDAEVNVAPLEGTAHGTVVVDGSIPCRELGKLVRPLTLVVRQGMIVDIEGEQPERQTLEAIFERIGRDEARWLAEFGIGLNPWAELTGRMLDDEGCAGTIHFGFGSNATIGGINQVPFHLDFVVCRPTVEVESRCIMEQGQLLGSDWFSRSRVKAA